MTLPAPLAALLHKPMEVKPCGFGNDVMASPASYRDRMSRFREPSMLEIANHADAQLASAWEVCQGIHTMNAAAIESNRSMRELLMAIMDATGMPKRYSHFGFPTPRSRFKKQQTLDAGYPKDINRTFSVDDGFDKAKETYERLKAEYAKYRVDAEKEGERKAAAAEQEKAKRRSDMDLARLIVRYGLTEDAEWSDVLDAVRGRDQYLDLAIAGQQTRGDWSEGFYRVQHAFDRFKINDDRDKEIAADICGCLAGDDDCRDGRVFRDIRWNYDALFKIVADQQLVADARLCMEHIS